MHPKSGPLREIDPSTIKIIGHITTSDASSIFEVEVDGEKYVLKLFHDNGDPGYAENGRDLNRFRCEFNAYEKLVASGVSEFRVVPKFHGYIDRVDPALFYPTFQHFAYDNFQPRGMLLEFLPNAESLNCVNFSDALFPQAIEGMKEIHKAGVHHRDIHPKNILLVRGNPERLVWIDFDVATTFTDLHPEQLARSNHEIELVEGLGDALVKAPLLPISEITI